MSNVILNDVDTVDIESLLQEQRPLGVKHIATYVKPTSDDEAVVVTIQREGFALFGWAVSTYKLGSTGRRRVTHKVSRVGFEVFNSYADAAIEANLIIGNV